MLFNSLILVVLHVFITQVPFIHSLNFLQMKILKNLAIVALLSTFALSCEKSSPAPQSVVVTPKPVEPEKPEAIDPNKCYEGEIVWITGCTRGIWVKVLNANIGDPSESPYPESADYKKWTNTIWIANGQMLKDVAINQDLITKKVFFKLDPTSNFIDCQEFRPIPCIATAESNVPPKKQICATYISFNKCN
jgi:hypothetical protein